MKHIRKIVYLVMILFVFFIFGCQDSPTKEKNEVINILYTTDVHCGVSDSIGYSSLSAYKKDLEASYGKVTLIDCGDAIQGAYVGAVTKGQYVIELMNEVGYDLYTLGNHEFDYGMDTLEARINEFNGQVLSCNVKYTGPGENRLSKVKPYEIIEYGPRKVAFIGITTPKTLVESNPLNFKENDEYVYSFGEDSAEDFYATIQSNIDECKSLGADYVILMAHLGYGEEYGAFSSVETIKNTKGADIVLDGHSHKEIICEYFENLDGKCIPLCGAGYKMSEFGRILISENGEIQVGLISGYPKKDPVIEAKITELDAELEEASNTVLAHSDLKLSISDVDGVRMVRSTETSIGNMVADSYRSAGNAQIGIVNGGGIRDSLPSGDLTFKDIMKLNPFGNMIMTVKATGSQILDFLEFATRQTQTTYKVDGKAVGENGCFASVSGLKYTIDTSVASSVVVDDKGNFAGVTGERRVKDVYVLIDGEYQPLDPDQTYVVASHDYLLLGGGDGAIMFTSCEVVQSEIMPDYEAIVRYIVDILNGHLAEKYSDVEGRITIE